jgi:hypothetical protein
MPSTDRKLELKAKTLVAQTGSQPFVYAKGLKLQRILPLAQLCTYYPSITITFIKVTTRGVGSMSLQLLFLELMSSDTEVSLLRIYRT